jgi:type VI secretion system protein ImpH
MADAVGQAGEHLKWLEELAREPAAFDFYAALRRIESFSATARLGEALRPSEEPVRIGQAPSLSFETSAVTEFAPGQEGSPGRLGVSFFGLWGPNGPLPMHLTEYARDRERQVADRTLRSFIDVFHHRLLLLFYRAWAQTQPTAGRDRPPRDRFAAYLGSLFGQGFAGTLDRDGFPDHAKLYYAGRFGSLTRNAEGLRGVVADYFGLPTQIEEFVGSWLSLSQDSRWHLGLTDSSVLGQTTLLGGRVWSRDDRFRVVLGPLSHADFTRFLPGGADMMSLTALVRLYTNDEWGWDVRLTLGASDADSMCLARGTRLGWTSRIGVGVGGDLVFDPMMRRSRRLTALRSAH